VRVLCVGAGSIGKRHIGNLLTLGCEVAALDPSEDSTDGLPDSVAVFRTGLTVGPWDALVIASPLDTHYTWAAAELMHGTPFFVEKPLGALDEIENWRALASACEARGIVTQVGYNLRFHPWAEALRAVPKPVLGRFACYADMATWPGSSYGPSLLELSHEIDLALHCGAPSSRVSVDIATDTRHVFSLCGEGKRWRVELDGAASRYERRWCVADEALSVDITIGTSTALGDAMYRAEIDHFLNAVRTGKQSHPAATLRDGIRVLEVCAMIEAQVKAHA
jgi:predicted dehydrogenase